MAVQGLYWDNGTGSTDFTFDANTSSISTWLTVITDTSESTSNTYPITIYRGVSGGGSVVMANLTATYVRTSGGQKQFQAFYKFTLEEWLQFRPSDNNYVTVWANSVNSTYAPATVYFLFKPIINNISITSNLPDTSVFIQGVSSYNYLVEAEGYGDATISSVSVKLGSLTRVNLTESDGVWTGSQAQNNTKGKAVRVGVEVTDNHRVTTYTDIVIVIQAHEEPSITTEIFRCDSNGDKSEDGSYLSITAYAASAPSVLGIYSLHLEGTIGGTSTSIISQYINSGETYILGNGGIVSTDSYNLTFVAVDNSATYGGTAKTATLEVGVPRLVRVINVKDGGTGLGIGQYCDTAGTIQTPWQIRSTKAGSLTDSAMYVFHATANKAASVALRRTDTDKGIELLVGSGGSNRGLYDISGSHENWILHADANDLLNFDIPINTNLNIAHPLSSGGYLRFYDTNGNESAYLRDRTSTTHRLDFIKRSYNSINNSLLSTYESYMLPVVDADRTASADYSILTTKAPVTIAQGGTGATDVAGAVTALGLDDVPHITSKSLATTSDTFNFTLVAGHMYLVLVGRYTTSATEATNGMYLVNTRSSTGTNGATITAIRASSVATLTNSGTTLTISTSATYLRCRIIDLG